MEGGWETAVLSCGGRCKDFAQIRFQYLAVITLRVCMYACMYTCDAIGDADPLVDERQEEDHL